MMYSHRARRTRYRVDEIATKYLRWIEDQYDSREPKNHRCAIARLLMHATHIDKPSWLNAIEQLRQDNLSISYQRGCHRRWLAMLAWAAEFELIDASTLHELQIVRFKPKQPNNQDIVRIDAQWCEHFRERFWATVPLLPKYMQNFARLLYHTGARPKEIRTLTSRSIETHNNQRVLVLETHKTATRTNRPRYIALNRPARLIVDRMHTPFTPNDWLFPARKDIARPIAASTVEQALKRTLKRNQIKRWTLYDCRRHAATVAVAQASPAAARALLGHADLRTTSLYAIPSMSDAMIAADVLEGHDEN